jgi:O-antigen ligase
VEPGSSPPRPEPRARPATTSVGGETLPSLFAAAWPRDRREAFGLGCYIGQLVTIFGIALSYAVLSIGALTALWAARGRASIASRLRTPGAAVVLVPLGAYLVLTAASVVLSYRPARSLDGLVDLLTLSPLVLGLLFVRGERRVRLVATCLVLLGVGLAAYGFLESLVGKGGLELDRRIHGPFSHYQTLAGVLLPCDLLALASLAHRPSPRRFLTWGALLLVSAALVLGLTRGAWVALAVALLLLLLLRSPRALLWVAPVAVVLLLVAPLRVVERAASIFDPYDSSNYDRLCMAWTGLLMIEERPLFGVGPNMVEELYPIYRHPTAPRLERPHLHNTFLQVAAERGVPALGALVALFAGSAVLAWRGFRREGGFRGARADLWVGALLGMVAFAVAGLFEDNWGDTEVQRILLFLLVVPVCLESPSEAEPEPEVT